MGGSADEAEEGCKQWLQLVLVPFMLVTCVSAEVPAQGGLPATCPSMAPSTADSPAQVHTTVCKVIGVRVCPPAMSTPGQTHSGLLPGWEARREPVWPHLGWRGEGGRGFGYWSWAQARGPAGWHTSECRELGRAPVGSLLGGRLAVARALWCLHLQRGACDGPL